MITASHHLTYPSEGPGLGRIVGPGADGVHWMAVEKEPAPDGKVRVGFYALDTQEAFQAAQEWAQQQGLAA